MPWTDSDDLPGMEHLDPKVRRKAMEIANALLEEGYKEERALAIAEDHAQRWTEGSRSDRNRELETRGGGGEEDDRDQPRERKPQRSGGPAPVEPLVEEEDTMLAEHDEEPDRVDNEGRSQRPGDDRDDADEQDSG